MASYLKVILVTLGFGAAYWAGDAYVGYVLGEGPFMDALFYDISPYEYYMRISIITWFGLAVLVVTYEIRRRERVEEGLRKSEHRYHLLFGGVNDAVFVHGITGDGMPGRFVEVNDVACSMLGYAREELLSMSPADIDYDGMRQRVPGIMEDLSASGHVLFETALITKSGREIPVEINSQVIEMDGSPTVLSVARDITNHKMLEDMLHSLSKQDGLTGLANRRTFDEAIIREWTRAMRERSPLSLVMIDIDHFKKFNDTYGHLAGDDCLRKVAACVRDGAKRGIDIAARYGGEEFVLLFPMTDSSGAAGIAECVRDAVEEMRIAHEGAQDTGYVTVSAGVATEVPEKGRAYPELVDEADRALYRAKAGGRNRVAVWDGAGPEQARQVA